MFEPLAKYYLGLKVNRVECDNKNQPNVLYFQQKGLKQVFQEERKWRDVLILLA